MADIKQFEELALPHLDTVYRAALAMCRQPSRADDLAQTTFTKALQSFKSFRTGTNIKAWLLRILNNTWIDELRHRKVVGPEVQADETLLGGEPTEETAWSDPRDLLENFSDEQVISALQELPDDQRLTLYLIDVEDLSQEDVAEITGVAVGTVKSRTSRARSALKQRLEQHAKDLGFTGRVS